MIQIPCGRTRWHPGPSYAGVNALKSWRTRPRTKIRLPRYDSADFHCQGGVFDTLIVDGVAGVLQVSRRMVGLILHSHSVSLGTRLSSVVRWILLLDLFQCLPMCPVQGLPNRGTSVPCSPLSVCQEHAIRRTIKSPPLHAPDSFPPPQIHLACLPKPPLRRRGLPRPPRSAPPKMIIGVSPSFGSPYPLPTDRGAGKRRNRPTQSCLNCHTSKRMVGIPLLAVCIAYR